MKKKETMILILMAVIYIAAIVFIYPQLPEQLPMQFSASGDVNWSLPKVYGIVLITGIYAFVFLNYFLAKQESKKSSIVILGVLLMITIGFLTYIAYYR